MLSPEDLIYFKTRRISQNIKFSGAKLILFLESAKENYKN